MEIFKQEPIASFEFSADNGLAQRQRYTYIYTRRVKS